MPKLIMCKGLPGSGKSTWAEAEAKQAGVVRVNKDDIRAELVAGGWTWSRENEKDVIAIRDASIRAAFKAGAHTVISDDTNYGGKHERVLRAIAAEFGAVFEVKVFDTPVDECIRRDSLRPKPVGSAVIRGMASQYGIQADAPPLVAYTPDPLLPPAVICDLDGTLALFDGQRSPYDTAKCSEDRVNKPVEMVLTAMRYGYAPNFIYMSGREAQFRDLTLQWLEQHGLPRGGLFMRSTGDKRKDWIVKGELFDQYVRGKYNVLFVLDDRNQVVEYWRKIGLTCLQVAEGAF